MQCEICGSETTDKPVKVTLEGATLNVCGKCSHYGKPTDKWSPVSRKMSPTGKSFSPRKPSRTKFDRTEDEINQDYAEIIKNARESQHLTIEQLASKIKEKVMLLRKIERDELVPEDNLRKKLESELHIKLTEKYSSEDQRGSNFVRGTTLGDVAIIRKQSKK